jgi:hypothetical protein
MLNKAREVLRDKDHPAWLGAWRFVAEQGYGKPEQLVGVAASVKFEVVVRRESREEAGE